MKQIPTILAPVALKKSHRLEAHGHQRSDPYYWLRDDSRNNPKVLNYINSENNYTRQKLAHTENLQKTLFTEMTERLEPNERSVPTFVKGYWHWMKYEEDMEYLSHIRQKGSANKPFDLQAGYEILLDENLQANGFEFYHLGELTLSQNQHLLAFSEDFIGRRQYTIRIKNLITQEFYPEKIDNTSGEIVWANDHKTLFYVRKNPQTLLDYQVYRHQIGTDPKDDILVYEETDNTFYTSIFKTRSEKYIGIHVASIISSEVHFIDAEDPEKNYQTFLSREKDHLFEVDHIKGYFYIQSDLNAPNEKIIRVEDNKIGNKNHWQEIVPHENNNLIQNFELFNSFLVSNERVNGVELLRIRNHQGELLEDIEFNDSVYTCGISYNPDPASNKLRYYYSSMTTPDSEFEYDFINKKNLLLKQDKVIGHFLASDYQSERLMISASDGKLIPVSMVYRKDKFKKNGNCPLLLEAYGAYGITIDPSFSISRLSLLDRGFVYAIAHIRGGKMLGRQWYEDGKKLSKINSFTDFIDVSHGLINGEYTNPKKLFAMGGSAGGLVMGAVINMAPELYHGVVAEVPFVDIVTSMLDESIPLTTGEYDEWGNPNDKVFYDYMLSYSPYDQLKKQDYPHLLVVTGLHDSQVQYWEPAKWVAKLRDYKTDNNLLLLDTDIEAGHGGKSGRYNRFNDIAKQYAFILDLVGIHD